MFSWTKTQRFLACVALGAYFQLSHAQIRTGDSLCAISDTNACSVEDISPSELDSSVVIYPGGETRCAFDDWSSTKTSFSTNSTYFFQVFPNADLSKKKLLLWFQGGGACIDESTCNFALQCMENTFTPSAKPLSTGLLNRSDSNNMFNDFNIVHLPYCTGDLHIGNSVDAPDDTAIDSYVATLQSENYCLGQNQSLHQNGYTNSKTVLEWAVKNFPNPEQIVIGGYSAGSLGAQLLTSYVADLWDVDSNGIWYGVLADSYVGVQPNTTQLGTILEYFGGCSVDLKWPSSVASICSSSSLNTVTLMTAIIESLPSTKYLYIDSVGDYTQRYFYMLAKDGILGYPFTDIISASTFYSLMIAILDSYKDLSSLISTFYVAGTQHVFLNSYFYSYVSNDDNSTLLGPYIAEWLGLDISSSSSSASSADVTLSSSGSENGSEAGSASASGSTMIGSASSTGSTSSMTSASSTGTSTSSQATGSAFSSVASSQASGSAVSTSTASSQASGSTATVSSSSQATGSATSSQASGSSTSSQASAATSGGNHNSC